MKVKKLLNSQWISLILLQLICLVSTLECPLECRCSILQKKNYDIYNHVKCLNASGINDIDKLSSITSLDLSNIGLLKISQRLDKLKNLTELNLSHNSLNDFSKLGKRVTMLDLSHNRIKSDKLTNIPSSIKSLDLSYNKITYIPRDIMNLKYLKSLKLNNNPINCSCETLEVRNWLQNHNILIDNDVKCEYPNKFRGTTLTEMNELDVCENFISPASRLMWDDENDIMLADGPVTESGSGENDDKDELETGFMPVNGKETKGISSDLKIIAESSGEGDESPRFQRILENTEYEDESGSGAIPFDNIYSSTTDVPINESSILVRFDTGLGIFSANNKDEVDSTTLGQEETTEDDGSSISGANGDFENIDPSINSTLSKDKEELHVSATDNKATYFLLIIFGCLVLGLIVFVALKKSRKQNRNRPKILDPEKQLGTELSHMDKQKKKLGKPVEHVPLMDKVDSREYAKPINGTNIDVPKTYQAIPNIPEASDDAPLLLPKEEEERQTTSPETENSKPNISVPVLDDHVEEPISEPTPVLSTFKSKPAPENSPEPKSLGPRYSPVYSPDTGRIKIKLIQTPKPKTPLLVTKSLSNAGDIITTPNLNQRL